MFNENDVRLRESLDALDDALTDDGYSSVAAERHVDELVTHATMARARTDLPPGAFRDFVTSANRMTRKSRFLSDLWICEEPLRRAACEALHDLIMEDVA